MKYSKGVSWIDDCRIPFVDENDNNTTRERYDTIGYGKKQTNGWGSMDDSAKQGRFPPNLLVCDDMLNDGSMTKSGFNPNAKVKQYGGGNFGGGKTNDNGIDYGDKGSNSRYYDLDIWFEDMVKKLR